MSPALPYPPQRPARRRRPRTFASAVIAGAVLLLTARPDPRAGCRRHDSPKGQITLDQAGAYEFAWDYPTKDEAQEDAVNACLSAGGGSDCTVLASSQQAAGALAVDQVRPWSRERARGRTSKRKRAPWRPERLPEGRLRRGGIAVRKPGRAAGHWSGSEGVLEAPAEGSGPTADASQDDELTHEERMQVQQGLAALGFDAGPADGVAQERVPRYSCRDHHFAAEGPARRRPDLHTVLPRPTGAVDRQRTRSAASEPGDAIAIRRSTAAPLGAAKIMP